MGRKQSDESFSRQETQRRLAAVFQGAFSGPPTQLKDIPTQSGDERRLRRPKPSAAWGLKSNRPTTAVCDKTISDDEKHPARAPVGNVTTAVSSTCRAIDGG